MIRETGLVVMSTGSVMDIGYLLQFSLQKGHLLKKQINLPCEHCVVYLLCIQVAGREYLALSCYQCEDIKLMNLNKQLSSGSLSVEYEVVTAFKDESVYRMCHGEENRIFVQFFGTVVLELDTSTTRFSEVRRITTGNGYGICYVPDPHQLIVVSDDEEVHAVSCDNDNKVVWKTGRSGFLLYVPSYEAILVCKYDGCDVVVLNPATGSEIKSIRLPDNVRNPAALCLFNNQIIVASYVRDKGVRRISFMIINN